MNPKILRCPLVPGYHAYKHNITKAIETVLESGSYILGENVLSFEKEFSSYIGCEYGIGVNSGTDALILGLKALDLKEGDEVITTPFTFYATYVAIRNNGAIPIFVDIDPDTWLMDLKEVEKAITSKTKAIMPVHLFGNAVDIIHLRQIVGEKIAIIEDCAQSHGAKVNGTMTGSLGDMGAFSFFPSKNLGGYGDGGMVVTNNSKYAEDIKKRRVFGMMNRDEFIGEGINSRLDELQAAILRVKLEHLDEMNRKRKELAKLYTNLLNPEFIRPQKVETGIESVYHVFAATTFGFREELIDYLAQENIQTNVYYAKPIYEQSGYTSFYNKKYKLPVVDKICNSIIALPFYPEMTEDLLSVISDKINRFYSVKLNR